MQLSQTPSEMELFITLDDTDTRKKIERLRRDLVKIGDDEAQRFKEEGAKRMVVPEGKDEKPVNALTKALKDQEQATKELSDEQIAFNRIMHDFGVTTKTDVIFAMERYLLAVRNGSMTVAQSTKIHKSLAREIKESGFNLNDLKKENKEFFLELTKSVQVQEKQEASMKKSKTMYDRMDLTVSKLNNKFTTYNESVQKNKDVLAEKLKLDNMLTAAEKKLAANIEITTKEMLDFQKQTDKVNTEMNKASKKISIFADTWGRLPQIFSRVGSALMVYKLFKLLEQGIKAAFEMTMEFANKLDLTSARLHGLTGSLKETKEIMTQVLQVNQQVPYTFDEITKAATILKARGIEPTSKMLKVLAATSLALDKPLEGIVDSFAKIQSGSRTTERYLKPLGIGFDEFTDALEDTTNQSDALLSILERNEGVLNSMNQTLPTLWKNVMTLVSQWTLQWPVVNDLFNSLFSEPLYRGQRLNKRASVV